jgi:transcription antitermination factor NusG
MNPHIVVRVHSGREIICRDHLRDRYALQAYCPTVIEERRAGRRAKRRVKVPVARYPGYMFCGFEDDYEFRSRWREVFRTNLVVSVLGLQGTPIIVPGDLMDRIRGDQEDARVEAALRFAVLDRVEIVGGAFWGLPAYIDELRSHEALVSVMTLFGRSQKVRVGFENLMPLGA